VVRSESRATRLFVTIAVVTALLTLVTQLPALNGPRGTVRGLAAPVTAVLSGALDRAGDGLAVLGDAAKLRSDNQRLAADNRALRQRLALLEAAGKENAELRKALAFERSFGHKLLAAEVIARSPDGLSRTVTIDRGRSDGVQPGMVVVNGSGLVGRVLEAGAHSAGIQTLVDAQSRVNAYTAVSGLEGTVIGQGGPLQMTVLAKPGVAARPGEWALTSGIGGTYPRGILVGQVAEFHRRDSATLETADLAPAIDFGTLSMVLVITDWTPAP
jgi:rod shape-determining protein MreC